ncbi:MAG: glycosyltransferase family 2 protein [Ruminococcaceae bacterium]|nr:glycosyltransferase family 2 protein [Oscillospiraceae bacterium]
MKISIIIPVYRVEAYITECVDSVLRQDYADFEIILVDDGSPDRCGAICDAYAAADPRVQVIHKENGGLSDARNAGLAQAVGDYVLFLDSDDYWNDCGVLSRLVGRVSLTGAELLNFSYQKFFEDTGEMEPYFSVTEAMPHPLELPQQLDWLTQRGLYIASACNKMIRRSLLDGLFFRKGVFSEDIEWCAALLLRAGSVDFVPEAFYCYRQRSGSIRHSIRDKNCRDLTDAILHCLGLCQTADDDRREALLRYTAFQYGTFIANQAHAEHPQDACIAELRPHAKVLRHHGGNKKLMILDMGCKLLGYPRLCGLIWNFYHIKRK